jgi:hypothetical protein
MKSAFCAALFICLPAVAGVVQPLQSAPQLLIPAAGSTAGVNGTFFRSDIALANLSDHAQHIRLQFLPQPGGASASASIVLSAHDWFRSDDFVRTQLGVTGLGAFLISGTTASGDLDPTAQLYANSRIWTIEPATGGTTSQDLPAIPPPSNNNQAATLFGVGAFGARFNVGIVNLDPVNPQTFSLFDQSLAFLTPVPPPVFMTVPPMSMEQMTWSSGPNVFPRLVIRNETDAPKRTTAWIAYGSTVDNTTGDAWSELAVAGAVP